MTTLISCAPHFLCVLGNSRLVLKIYLHPVCYELLSSLIALITYPLISPISVQTKEPKQLIMVSYLLKPKSTICFLRWWLPHLQ